jgi:hypothetical protein
MASLLLSGDFQMNVEKYIDSVTGKIAVLYSPPGKADVLLTGLLQLSLSNCLRWVNG